MSNDFKLGITGAIEPNITFLGGASKEVLRLSKDGIWANPDIPADDAAKLVLAVIDHNIKVMVDKAVNDKLQGAANYIDALGGDSKKYRQTLAQPAPYMAVSNDRMSVDPHTGNVSIGTPPEKNT